MRKRSLILALAGVALMLGTVLTGSSGAAGTITITPNPVTVTPDQQTATVTANWSGQSPNKLLFFRVCKKSITDASFSVSIDCSSLSEVNLNGTADGSGTAQIDVFRGENPDGDTGWGCFAEGDTPPQGIEKFTTCYVRLTNNVITNKDEAVEQAFTFTVGGDEVPEAPLGLLLPVLGGAVALGGFLVIRRRAALS